MRIRSAYLWNKCQKRTGWAHATGKRKYYQSRTSHAETPNVHYVSEHITISEFYKWNVSINSTNMTGVLKDSAMSNRQQFFYGYFQQHQSPQLLLNHKNLVNCLQATDTLKHPTSLESLSKPVSNWGLSAARRRFTVFTRGRHSTAFWWDGINLNAFTAVRCTDGIHLNACTAVRCTDAGSKLSTQHAAFQIIIVNFNTPVQFNFLGKSLKFKSSRT
jgi:hypothetical protein